MAKPKRRKRKPTKPLVSKKQVVDQVEVADPDPMKAPLRTDWKPAWMWMHENGSIDDDEAEACIRYSQDYAICGYDRGAGAMDYSRDVVDGGGWGDMSDRRAVAMHRFAKIQRALTPDQQAVCMSCLGDGNSVSRHAAIARKRKSTISDILHSAIAVLAGPHGYRTKLPPVRHTIRTAFDCDMLEAA